jgi:hypothetical protein
MQQGRVELFNSWNNFGVKGHCCINGTTEIDTTEKDLYFHTADAISSLRFLWSNKKFTDSTAQEQGEPYPELFTQQRHLRSLIIEALTKSKIQFLSHARYTISPGVKDGILQL